MLVLACALLVLAATWLLVRRHQRMNAHLLAVSQTDGNKVTLLALDEEERKLETFPVACKGPFGLDFTNDGRWLYVACWDHSQVVLIDTSHRRKPQIFAGGHLPAWIQARAGSDETWISNEGSGTVTVYRSGTSTSLATISTDVGPSDIVFDRTGKEAWVSNETAGNVSRIDAMHHRKLLDVPVGKVPQGMALTTRGDRLLVANFGSNTVSVLDTRKAREVERVPVCDGPVDVAVAARDGSELAYVSCYKSGIVGVVDINRKQEVQRIVVGEKPFGMAPHPDGKRVYVCVGGANQLVVIETGQPSRIIRRIKLDGNPLRIAVR